MLKAFSRCSPRLTPSTSFHTSATLQATSFKRRRSRAVEKANLQKRADRDQQIASSRPHVVVGHRPDDVAKWENCDLAKVIITEEAIAQVVPESLPTGEVYMPTHFNYGIGAREKEMLFETLPQLTAMHAAQTQGEGVDPEKLEKLHAEAEKMQAFKTKQLARIVSLRNANAKGIAYENRRRIVAEFSTPANPEDTGRPEVQAALLTYKIRNLWTHLQKFKSDVGNRRGLTKLVHQRAKVLKYIKNTDRDRYDMALQRLGLEAGAVEGELVV